MQNLELNRQLQRLQSLISKTLHASANDFELQSHWGRYVCVLVAGFLENSLAEIYTEYVQKSASPPVANFTVLTLSRIQNPRASRFIETAQSFKKIWGEELESFMSQNGRKDAIDSIMNNRHQIAHGRDSGITVARASEYLRKCVEVIEFMEAQCRS
jgi:hypothetical protein